MICFLFIEDIVRSIQLVVHQKGKVRYEVRALEG